MATGNILIHASVPPGHDNLVYYMGAEDSLLCRCGNDASSEGFISLNADLSVCNLSTGADPRAHHPAKVLCVSCGRTYHDNNDTHVPVRLQGDTFPAAPEIEFYVEYAPADNFGKFTGIMFAADLIEESQKEWDAYMQS